MPGEAARRSRRVLDPSERISEVLFGLIMVLTFTGSLSISEARRDDVRAMLIAALGCNIAWGVIDGIFYVMGALAEKRQGLRAFLAVRQARTPGEAHRAIADALPPVIASVLEPADLERVHRRLLDLPAPPAHARLDASDLRGAIAVFLLVFLSTLPLALPFVFMQDAVRALRVSNAIAIAMLFVLGVAYGRSVGRSPWVMGLSMVVLGSVLVALTIALGG